MTFRISKRSLIRLISFIFFGTIVCTILIYQYAKEASDSKRALEYQYMKTVEELTHYSQNISSDLTKIMYSNSPELLSDLSAKLWRESGFAKSALDSLPVDYKELQNTNKLLSQVGEYCLSLSKTFADGSKITQEQRQNIEKLNGYCEKMTEEIITVQDSIRTGSLTLTKVKDRIEEKYDRTPAPVGIAEGFGDFESGLVSYPVLIYDGPFSDHIMQKEPERLKGEPDVSREDARKKAAKACVINESDLKDDSDENSKTPSFCFSADGVNVSITKKGGLISYMLKSRLVYETKIDIEAAKEKSRLYMDSLGIGAMEITYFETSNNIVTFNYAYTKDNVIFYTDLIKVSVALDTGEIMGFNARGFIVNHKPREIKPPKYSKEVCKLSLNDLLTPERIRLCVIPSNSLEEKLCYEFKCKSKDGKDLLVYINANTNVEEQILILLVRENGTLTI